jgi:hypothetical protein
MFNLMLVEVEKIKALPVFKAGKDRDKLVPFLCLETILNKMTVDFTFQARVLKVVL